MKERLIKFLAHAGIGQTKFEEKVGLSRGFVTNIGENLTSKTLKKITDEYPELNTNWLKTGEGEMLMNGNNFIGHTTYGSKSPITGDIEIYKAELDKAKLEISYLEQIIKDKDEIIDLLKNK